MKIFIIIATHPQLLLSIIHYRGSSHDADVVASDLVNQFRADIDAAALPPVPHDRWLDGLIEAQRLHLGRDDRDTSAMDGKALADQSGFDVHVMEAELEGFSAFAVDDRERSTILAALRGHQRQDCPFDLLNIATNGHRHGLMTTEEIDSLCERLNCDTSTPTATNIVVALDGGLVQGVVADRPVVLCVVDYDVEGAASEDLTLIPQDGRDPVPAAVSTWTLDGVCIDPGWIAEINLAVG